MLEYKTGEVWVYLTAKYADYLKISHPDFSSIEFTLPVVVPVEVVEKPKTDVGYITVKTTPKGAYVLVDNKIVGTDGYYWSSDPEDTPYLRFNNAMLSTSTNVFDQKYGLSVRKEKKY